MPQEVMDIQGLGKYLKLAPVTLYKMVKEGKIPCRRIGKSLRFPKAMIDRWLHEEKGERNLPPAIKRLLLQFTSQVKKQLGNRVKEIYLYGSWARNEARIDSDIDIAVLVDRKDLAIMKAISEITSDISLETDHFLSAVIIEWESHQRGKRENYPFHLQIDREGILL